MSCPLFGGAAKAPPSPLVTLTLLRRLFPTGRQLEAFAQAMATHLPAYGLDRPARLAAFLGQVGHESGGLAVWVENLNYSAEALRRVWPTRFDAAAAAVCARQPERVANRAYAGRMGNGDEASGDGWRFRGRGLIQLTGRTNYTALAEATGRPLDTLPAWLETPEGATVSAAWFWQSRGLNAFADAGDVEAITRRTNGGLLGLDDRRARTAAALAALA